MTEETEFGGTEPLAVSLDLELSALERVARGAQILVDIQCRRGLMDEAMERDSPECVFSILGLLGGRIDQVRRVIRSEESPASICSPHNEVEATEPLGESEGDVVLVAWNGRRVPVMISRPTGVETESEDPPGPAPKPRGARPARHAPDTGQQPEHLVSVPKPPVS